MFSKPKNWISGGLWKPKSPHSLDHLKYLHAVLCKNQIVTDQNRALLVETLRSIAELLIWGDQNDSSVFDFFLEKNMLTFFLKFMRQKSGRYICVQLLQTLNILFENINNKTSVYYLLSNNHINSIIVHKFDFSDEEVMAYYISFLKTLSLKLNRNTIHFFYNEHTNDFALYTEAIKFFNHPESMVRIAVRTITLNVYKVDDKSMLRYIRDKTAAPYFSNLVWFIGNHVLELDSCVRHDIDHNSRERLSDLVAEHLDHLHYLNDIFCLHIEALNEVLTDHLLNRLLIPLYVYSLTKKKTLIRQEKRACVSSVVSLFLLSQVFLIMHHPPLVRVLADIILNGDLDVCCPKELDSPDKSSGNIPGFSKPPKPIEEELTMAEETHVIDEYSSAATLKENEDEDGDSDVAVGGQGDCGVHEQTEKKTSEDKVSPQVDSGSLSEEIVPNDDEDDKPEAAGANVTFVSGASDEEDVIRQNPNSTDEEKLLSQTFDTNFSLNDRPYLEAIFSCFDTMDSDYEVLFALCLLYALGNNTGINQEILDTMLMPTDKSLTKSHYNTILVEKLIRIITNSCQSYSRIRLTTLELTILFLKLMVCKDNQCYLHDNHLAAIIGATEEATLQLRNFYKSEEIFLDMFEDEYREMQNHPLNVEYLTMDASILLPPTGTPLTGIEFNKRLPCGEVERARRAIRVFFLLRDLSLTLKQETEHHLPLTKQEECVNVGDILDLNNSDLIACTVIQKENHKERRFLVIDVLQLILVEPDSKKLGWGVVKFVGFLQDVEVTGDKEDSRSLHVTIHKPAINIHAHPLPLLSARFIFDDHIRCMAAKQRLTKGRLRARQRKMQMIARLLELPSYIVDSMYQPSPAMTSSAATLRTSVSSGAIPGRSHPVAQRSVESSHPPLVRTNSEGVQNVREQNAASNTRQLPRHLASKQSRSITVRGSRPGTATRQRPVQDNIQRVMEEAGITCGSGDSGNLVEQAEEAIASPDAHARQSLNPQPEGTQIPDGHARSSRSSSLDSNTGHGAQEVAMIPLEDLSKKGSQPGKHADLPTHSAKKSRNSPEGKKPRSGSVSPRRTRRASGGSASPRGRSKPPVSSVATDNPPDATVTADASANQQEVTSFIKDANNEKSGKSSQGRSGKKQSRERQLSGKGPKSLTPAPEPSLSLVVSCEDASVESSGLGSPKLLPPADPDQLLTGGDKAVGSLPLSNSQTGSPSHEQNSQRESAVSNVADDEHLNHDGGTLSNDAVPFVVNRTTEPSVGENNISADISKVELALLDGASASDQLNTLAHLVTDTEDDTSPVSEQQTETQLDPQSESCSS